MPLIERDDVARLDEMRRYELFDADDADLARLAELAARVTGAPIALITLVDEQQQRLLAQFGAPPGVAGAVPLQESVCVRALDQPDAVVVIEDLLSDTRCHGLELIRALDLRFYAAAALTTPGGHTVGTICVFDRQPRALHADAQRALALVRDETMQLLETRRELMELRRSEALRQEAVEALMATQQDLQRRIDLRTREVEEAHKRTRQLLERINDGFIALDRDWRYTYVNERAGQLFGRNPAELIGKRYHDVFPEARGHAFDRAYERAMREQVMIAIEAQYEPWGRWFENRIYPSPDGFAVFFTEITERKRAEAELERSRMQLVDAQRVAHVGSWEWDVAGNSVSWSEELYRIYGLPMGSALGGYEGFLSRVHPADLEATKKVIGAALSGGASAPFIYDHRIVRPDGSVRMLHTRGESIFDGGRPVRLIGCCWDVTELHDATHALERTIALTQAMLDVTSDGLAVVGSDGVVSSYNEQLASLLGLGGERRARTFDELTAPLRDAERLRARVRALAADEESVDTVTLRDGRAVEVRSRPQLVGGEVAGRVWSFRPLPRA